MKISHGNEKLGSNCYVVSRPVGDTCPTGCFFLHNGCYAEKTEKRFPNARQAGMNNLAVTKAEIKELIERAEKDGLDIRLHERGDFLNNNKLDLHYIQAWKDVLKKHQLKINIWCYTHAYYKTISDLQNYGVKVYASVHSKKDIQIAKRAGFTRFAYIVSDKRAKGGSLNAPKSYKLPILGETLTCPEQRFGRKNKNKNVTCAGTKDSIACKLCCKGLKNVVFLSH